VKAKLRKPSEFPDGKPMQRGSVQRGSMQRGSVQRPSVPRSAATAGPAVPSTPAQHDRRDRILETATMLLSAGGEDALQMKDLSLRADVSLATLYRYFPAKDHVLLAITLSRYEVALARVQAEQPRGRTVRERVTGHLLREFRAEQREPRLTGALSRAISETSRSYSATIERIERVHLQVIRHVAAAGAPLSARHDAVLPVVADVFTAATRRWLAGVSSPAATRFEIRLGCRLLDLADEALDEEIALAGPAAGPGRGPGSAP
jgi:TetR/AcrR family transcriptional regulator, cholesterol catabolism regulator